jgi:hypothetical protein
MRMGYLACLIRVHRAPLPFARARQAVENTIHLHQYKRTRILAISLPLSGNFSLGSLYSVYGQLRPTRALVSGG